MHIGRVETNRYIICTGKCAHRESVECRQLAAVIAGNVHVYSHAHVHYLHVHVYIDMSSSATTDRLS